MQQFAKAYKLRAELHDKDGSPWLEADEPALLANFIAFCEDEDDDVYLRGENCRRGELLPSLFRGAVNHCDRTRRRDAYLAFISELLKAVTGTRFEQSNFGAVLQHYGFKTPWLDVLDDIHTAVWFALHELSPPETRGARQYRPIEDAFGWVLVLAPPRDVRRQKLRKKSSRNTRCHVQQGLSLAMQTDAEALKHDQDFANYVVGKVRIPNCRRWCLHGFRASQEYLFPSSEIDNTYKQLLQPRIAKLAEEMEHQHGVPLRALGRVAKYNKEDTWPAI